MVARLGVNIDHVATLRQARGEEYPSIVEAAKVVLENGADQITIHLREDRRHIQDTDVEAVRLVTQKFGRPLNLEMGCVEEILEIAIATAPDWICLVPEKREERTTEGGLALENDEVFEKVKSMCSEISKKMPKTKVSLFVEAKKEVLERCHDLKAHAVEIHTGDYAKVHINGDQTEKFLKEFKMGRDFLPADWGYHAGHGLTDESLEELCRENIFEEYNIGHWIICQSVFEGMATIVSKLKKIIEKNG